MTELSNRLLSLPPYIFSELNRLKADAQSRGIKLTSLAIGDPDLPTPGPIVEAMVDALKDPSTHMYSPYEGTAEFREAVARYMGNRFGVTVDPKRECTALIGSKEGIAHFPVAFLNPGDVALYPSPGYPVFQSAIILADARAVSYPLTAQDGFLPDPKTIDALMREHQPKYILLNFPSNPTSALCSKERLAEIVKVARQHQVIIAYDNAYSEIYYDAKDKPPSILEIEGAKDIAIEFHSLSKTFNMTGWRIGFAVGNEKLVQGLLKVKTNIDSGPLMSVQRASAFALDNSEKIAGPIREVYLERRNVLEECLRKAGIEFLPLRATFFAWARVPGNQLSMDFCKSLIEKHGLVVTPGVGFGKEGEGFFRLAMTVPSDKIREAASKLISL